MRVVRDGQTTMGNGVIDKKTETPAIFNVNWQLKTFEIRKLRRENAPSIIVENQFNKHG